MKDVSNRTVAMGLIVFAAALAAVDLFTAHSFSADHLTWIGTTVAALLGLRQRRGETVDPKEK